MPEHGDDSLGSHAQHFLKQIAGFHSPKREHLGADQSAHNAYGVGKRHLSDRAIPQLPPGVQKGSEITTGAT